jgi:STE24 endopeptidase
VGSSALRIGAVAAGAVLVAEAAVWLLEPRGNVLEPLTVEATDYFSADELERAGDFRSGQRALALGGLAVDCAVLAGLALWRPAPLRRILERAARRPVLGAAAIGAGISLTLVVVGLPLSAAAHERARDVGLATQAIGPWLGDVARSAAIGAVFAAAGAAAAIGMIRRMGRRWWMGGAVLVLGFAVVTSWLAPVVIAPVFNDFRELPPGQTRSDVLELGERAGVDIGEVYEVDASRRSTGLNAYVNGIGSTKRVVLYDNLLREQEPEVVNSVVAHELGHVAGDDIWRGLAFVALVAPLGALLVQVSTGALVRRSGDSERGPGAVPALALSLALATLVVGVAGQQLSRRVEARADTFALELTRDPAAFVRLQRELARTNVSDPDPPGLFSFLFGSHPTTIERIGAAEAFEKANPEEFRGGS